MSSINQRHFSNIISYRFSISNNHYGASHCNCPSNNHLCGSNSGSILYSITTKVPASLSIFPSILFNNWYCGNTCITTEMYWSILIRSCFAASECRVLTFFSDQAEVPVWTQGIGAGDGCRS